MFKLLRVCRSTIPTYVRTRKIPTIPARIETSPVDRNGSWIQRILGFNGGLWDLMVVKWNFMGIYGGLMESFMGYFMGFFMGFTRPGKLLHNELENHHATFMGKLTISTGPWLQ